uniref:Uncharacterized protein n=1 Tax=Noccaea caerulescens TaxID=107243 RepID=A0A1J3IAK2_NOCCA
MGPLRNNKKGCEVVGNNKLEFSLFILLYQSDHTAELSAFSFLCKARQVLEHEFLTASADSNVLFSALEHFDDQIAVLRNNPSRKNGEDACGGKIFSCKTVQGSHT